MVITWSEAKAAYSHILDNVLGRTDGSPLKSALDNEGIEDIFQLTNLDAATIDQLSYEDVNNNNLVTPVSQGDKMLVRCFINYVVVRHNEVNPVGDDWNNITQAHFDAF
jgi:hypothetical protein